MTSTYLTTYHLACTVTFVLMLLGGALVLAGRALPVFARWLPVKLAVAFFYLNLFAAQALLTFARNRGLNLW